MKDDRLIDWPAPTMPTSCYRALHSVLVDTLFAAPRELRHAVIDAAGGLTAGHMMLAIAAGHYQVAVRMEQDRPWLWLSYRSSDGVMPVVACLPETVGADPALVLREQEWLLEDALREITGGAW